MALFSETELLARQVLANRDPENNNEVIIAGVFKAMWSAAMQVEQIESVGCAMYGFLHLDLQATLTAMTKKKILRSRVYRGKRFYEVAF